MLRRCRRALLRQRRLLTAVLLAVTVLAFADQLKPDSPAQAAIVVAARDLPAGRRIGPADVRVLHVPADAAPTGASSRLDAVIGETVAGPMRTGEPVTDRRVMAASLVAGYPAGS